MPPNTGLWDTARFSSLYPLCLTPVRSTMEVTGQMPDTIFPSFSTSPLYLYVLSDHPCLLLLSLPPVLSAWACPWCSWCPALCFHRLVHTPHRPPDNHYILDQPCVIMLVRAHTVRQFIMEPPASVIAASEPPDQAPFLPASRFSLHASSAVPVLKGTSTAWADAFFFTGY